MVNMCYVEQYSTSFNKVINWLDIFSGIYFRNILSYFKFHIIFFLLCITSKKILVGYESQTNLFHAFALTFLFKINLVLPLGLRLLMSKVCIRKI